MEWVKDNHWHKWFAWHRVLIPGIIGKSTPKIVWLKTVERKLVVNSGAGSAYSPYVTYEYRDSDTQKA